MKAVDAMLETMRAGGVIDDLDAQFGRFVARKDEVGGATLAASAALVSAAAQRGHTGIRRERLAAQALSWVADSGGADALLAVIENSPVCGDGGSPTPLVADGRRLYLYRYWTYERDLAAELHRRNGPVDDAPDSDWLRPRLDRLFPGSGAGKADWQKLAAALAMLRRLTVVSGGPGTGKTSTVVRMLALMLEHAGDAGCRIALAAPTGKAAARMQQAIDAARADLPVDAVVREMIPSEAVTIHRLLGARVAGGFRHGPDNPLDIDMLVVDEVSMVDIALMSRLVAAVPAHTRIVLLGDRDQLASVEPGSVFAELCLGANGFTPVTADTLAIVTGFDIAPANIGVLPDCAVALKQSYRFAADSGIGALTTRARDGDVEAAISILEAGREDVEWITCRAGGDIADTIAGRLLPDYSRRLAMIRDGADANTIFAAYAGLQALCPLRTGRRGVIAINRAVERLLGEAGLIDPDDAWYIGRPIMVTANDYGAGLFNGDMGVVLPWGERVEKRVAFPGEGEPRWFHPARLPEHETDWAMTVHKSQGSEFDAVVVIFPEDDVPLLSRELVYTAVSRARNRVSLWGNRDVITAALGRRVERETGLAERLAAGA